MWKRSIRGCVLPLTVSDGVILTSIVDSPGNQSDMYNVYIIYNIHNISKEADEFIDYLENGIYNDIDSYTSWLLLDTGSFEHVIVENSKYTFLKRTGTIPTTIKKRWDVSFKGDEIHVKFKMYKSPYSKIIYDHPDSLSLEIEYYFDGVECGINFHLWP